MRKFTQKYESEQDTHTHKNAWNSKTRTGTCENIGHCEMVACLFVLSYSLALTHSTLCIRCCMRNTGYLCFCMIRKKRISSRIIVAATYLFILGMFRVARWLRLLWTPFLSCMTWLAKKAANALTAHGIHVVYIYMCVYVLRGPFDFVSHRHSHHHCLHVELCHHSRHVAHREEEK